MLQGLAHERLPVLALFRYTTKAFGLQLALRKAERGTKLQWIGAPIQIDEPNKMILLSPPVKLVAEVTQALQSWSGRVSLKALKAITGKLSWIAGIIPRSRWAVSVFYGTIADHERDVASGAEARRAEGREDPRDKSQLVPVKRLGLAREWLFKMLTTEEIWRIKQVPLLAAYPKFAVTTDASPRGLGAILSGIDLHTDEIVPLAAVKGKVTKNMATSWASLTMTRRGRPPWNLGWLSTLNMEELTVHHLAGKLNVQADHLSRPDLEGEPPGLEGIQIRVMNEAWMLDSRLPPPGVQPGLWGKAPTLMPMRVCSAKVALRSVCE
eukprot:s2029_g13.t1